MKIISTNNYFNCNCSYYKTDTYNKKQCKFDAYSVYLQATLNNLLTYCVLRSTQPPTLSGSSLQVTYIRAPRVEIM